MHTGVRIVKSLWFLLLGVCAFVSIFPIGVLGLWLGLLRAAAALQLADLVDFRPIFGPQIPQINARVFLPACAQSADNRREYFEILLKTRQEKMNKKHFCGHPEHRPKVLLIV
jgi:hypothetical protein